MPRYIDADALKEEIRFFSTWIMKWNENSSLCREVLSEAKKSYLCLLEESPTIDAAPVVHGHWINAYPDIEPNPMFMYGICSVCGFEQSLSDKLKYCPNCGAKTDKEAEHAAD